jgi:xanthine dehydrogenase iron-sulfur cluster and FAD-binding subunit A
MLARFIRSYHRPDRMSEALALLARGGLPLAGGTRLLAAAAELPVVVDLAALGLAEIEARDGELHLGAMVTLQDVIDSPLTYGATGGLLPTACRAQSSSRQLRGMATLGGESAQSDPDSEVVAALLALDARVVVTGPGETVEIPALRFVRTSARERVPGSLITRIVVPTAPDGAALERVAVLPSAPPLLAVAAAVALGEGGCARVRLALTGLTTPPARLQQAESRLEAGEGDGADLSRQLEPLLAQASFREDPHAPASYRRAVAGPLVKRAFEAALQRARGGGRVVIPRPWPRPPRRPVAGLPSFDSGPIEVAVNGSLRRAAASATTSLLEWLRREGLTGVKHGCETGECGACTVLLDGLPVNACLTLAARAHGRLVETVESLGSPGRLHPVQSAFVDAGAIQCGFCTPAMELCAKALLDALPDPTEAEAREALAGCLCRCTGYVKPVEAVLAAARQSRTALEPEAEGSER